MTEPDLSQLFERIAGYGRHMLDMPFSGPTSFFRTDVVDSLEGVDIALIGVPTDAGLSHRPGARYGPQAVRAQSGLIRYINPYTGVIPYEHGRVVDAGDVPFQNTLVLDDIVREIFSYYMRVVVAGVVPISVGGDHSITYPILKAVAKDGPVGLIHFDSHHDTAPPMKGSRFHHGAPFRNAVEDGLIDPHRTVQIAIRDPYRQAALPYAEAHGFTVLDMPLILREGLDAVVATTRKTIGDGPVYLTFDVDALDPAFAPGTGTPVVGGLSSREAMILLQGLRGLNIVGADVVEVSPPYDPTGMTALAGAQILMELLCLASESLAKK
ncbi:agmatinase/guanidinopropionase [Singulisphaera sp. GP187]|uniref:agmatinase n=1 Tax=Singulisphaera sp. GP187 TaxID=1882752 RepID=UPI00092A34E8|nr:agmatinase [Singulisphaera sp. GP187]SIO25675.1 agmatinase/guanidinopropionase [Singulisphaera sp. GP187]